MQEAADECFAGFGEHLLTEAQIMRYISKMEKTVKKKKTPVMAIAFATTLMLGGIALAAGFGVFGSFTNREDNELRAARLQKLDALAVQIGQTAMARASGEKQDETSKALGLYDGEISGVLDGETRQAVKTFQQEHGLGGDPFNWTSDAIRGYALVAGDEVLANLAGGLSGIVDGSYSIEVRFDLPQSMENLALRPIGEEDASHDIPLK